MLNCFLGKHFFEFIQIVVYLHRQVLNNQLLRILQGGNAAKVIGCSGVI